MQQSIFALSLLLCSILLFNNIETIKQTTNIFNKTQGYQSITFNFNISLISRLAFLHFHQKSWDLSIHITATGMSKSTGYSCFMCKIMWATSGHTDTLTHYLRNQNYGHRSQKFHTMLISLVCAEWEKEKKKRAAKQMCLNAKLPTLQSQT